jgi:hypothetical protein
MMPIALPLTNHLQMSGVCGARIDTACQTSASVDKLGCGGGDVRLR